MSQHLHIDGKLRYNGRAWGGRESWARLATALLLLILSNRAPAQGSLALHWLVVGPFYDETNAQERDFLKAFGHAEDDQSLQQAGKMIAAVTKGVTDPVSHRPIEIHSLQGEKPFNLLKIFRTTANKGTPTSAAYFYSRLLSATPRTVYLLTASDDGLVIWLNNRRVFSWWRPEGRALRLYDDIIRLDLAAGSNILLAKACNIEGGWAFAAKVLDTPTDAVRCFLDHRGELLKQRVVEPGQALQFTFATGYVDASEVTITELRDDRVPEPLLPVGNTAVAPLAPGLYRIRLSIGGVTYTESFCVGDPTSIAGHLLGDLREHSGETWESMSLYSKRIAQLLESKNVAKNDERWNRKVLNALEAIDSAVAAVGRGVDPILARSGLHLVAFHSVVDDQLECFRLAIPSAYDGKRKLPLIIVPPTAIETPRPFIESPFIADEMAAERLAIVASKYKCALVWIGYRSPPCASLGELNYFEEVMAVIRRHFPVDDKRLYLLATCSSGLTSAMMAARWPYRFAAIGMVNPVLHRRSSSWLHNDTYSHFQAYQSWMRHLDPVARFASISGLKVWIVQTNDDPEHGPKWHSESLQKAVNAIHSSKHPLQLKIDWEIGTTFESDMEIWAERFVPWFAGEARAFASDFSSEDSGNQPILKAFTHRFMLVEPTLLSEHDRTRMSNTCDAISNLWRQGAFGPCLRVKDHDVTKSIQESCNLILVGNDKCNLAWRSICTDVPIEISDTRLRLGHHVWQGRDLSIEVAIKNPSYPERTIVFIGSYEAEKLVLPTINFLYDGWYSYCVSQDGSILELGDWRERL